MIGGGGGAGRPQNGRRRVHGRGLALAIKACERGYRVAFATAQEWVSRLEQAQDRNQLEAELRRLERYHLLVVDEVGYLPLERQAANLFFALVSRRVFVRCDVRSCLCYLLRA